MSCVPSSLSPLRALFRHFLSLFFFNDTPTTEIYTLSLHDVFRSCLLPGALVWASSSIRIRAGRRASAASRSSSVSRTPRRSEEHTSELQSLRHLVCRLLLEKKKNNKQNYTLRKSVVQTNAERNRR